MDAFSTAIVLLAGALAIVIPIALIYFYARKHSLSLKIALYGAGFFLLVQFFHTPLVILTQSSVYLSFIKAVGNTGAIILIAVYLGALAALFEEISRYLIFKKFLKQKTLEGAKLFGLGWGGVEAVLLMGLLGTVSVFVTEDFFNKTDFSTLNQTLLAQGTPPQIVEMQVDFLLQQKAAFEKRSPFEPLLGFYERLLAIAFHVCASILVMQSVLSNSRRGLYAALGWHFLLDAVLVFLAYSLGTGSALLVEGALTLIVVAFVFFTARELKAPLAKVFA